MAEDWIKIRTRLDRDPKVIAMAEFISQPDSVFVTHVSRVTGRDMSVTRNALRKLVVGGLVPIWGAVRSGSRREEDDAVLPNANLQTIDELSDLPGFGEAMAAVGWVREECKSLIFPNFFEELNSGASEAKRAAARERQRRFRERRKADSDVTQRNALQGVTSRVTNATEKRREEKSKGENPPYPPELDSPEFREAWEKYVAYRKRRRLSKLLPESVELRFKSFIEWGVEAAIEQIEYTIKNGYQGIPEPKATPSKPQDAKRDLFEKFRREGKDNDS